MMMPTSTPIAFHCSGLYLVDARNKVEAAINSLPPSDAPEAIERFGEAERVLASAKRHLGEELHEQFSITLADMKPEYVA
ncbi:hypothetical protein D3C78_667060 [compost metagenome]